MRGGVGGYGVVESGEQCDLFALGGETCTSLGFAGGTLACTVTCNFDTTACTNPPVMDVGGPCLENADCNGGLCLSEVSPSVHWGQAGGYCYEPCDVNGGCPLSGADGICLSFSSGAQYCLASCDLANPACGLGQSCVDEGGVGACLWGNCTADSDCLITGDCDTDPASAEYGWCITPAESCANAVDDDFDTLIDCEDPECTGDVACPSGEICGNGTDDDGDGYADCADGECYNAGICTGETCTPAPSATLTCGATLTGQANNAAGSTNVVLGAECVDPSTGLFGVNFVNELGPEYAYTLTVTQPQLVTVTVDNFSGDLDVYILKDFLGACDPYQGCFQWGGQSVGVPEVMTFTAHPGVTYYVVVDGFGGDVSTYDIAVTCAAAGYEDCANATDDDGDGLVDCNDPECWGVGACPI